ncbi:hypothetical protein LX88_001643 [Lentzea californiensis]|nr:hypothetical protein [Lentzea californiensis]
MVMRDGPQPRDRVRGSDLGPPPLPDRIRKIPRHQHGEVKRSPSLISMGDMAHNHRIPKLGNQRATNSITQLRNPRPASSSLQGLNTNTGVQQGIPLPRPVEPPVQPRSAHGPAKSHDFVPAQRSHGRGTGSALPPKNHQARLLHATQPKVLLDQISLSTGHLQGDLSLVHIGQPSDISQNPSLSQRPHQGDPGLPPVNHKPLVPGPHRLGPNPHGNLSDNPEQPFTTKHQLLQIRTSSRRGRSPGNPLANWRSDPNRLDHVLEPPIPGRGLAGRPGSSEPTNRGPLERLRHMTQREPVLPQQLLRLRPGDPSLQNSHPRHRIDRDQSPKPGKVQRHDSRLGSAQSLNATHHRSTTTERHHSDVVLDTNPKHLKDFLGRARLHHGIRHSELPMPTTPQQVQVRQPTSTPKPVRILDGDRTHGLQRRESVLSHLRRRHHDRHLGKRLPQPDALTEPSQRMRRQRHGFGGPSSPGHCYSVTHDVSTSHPRRPARRHP